MMDHPKPSSRSKGKKSYPPPFSIRFTEDERRNLEKAAGGRPLAAYIRWLIFKEIMPEMPKKRSKTNHVDPDQKELAKLLGVLGRSNIANNINQLARAANSGSLPVNHDILKALKDAVEAVFWMRDSLIKILGLKPLRGERGEQSDDPER